MDGRVKPGQDGRGSEASRRQPTHSYRYKSILFSATGNLWMNSQLFQWFLGSNCVDRDSRAWSFGMAPNATGLMPQGGKRSFASRRMVQLVAALGPSGASFEALRLRRRAPQNEAGGWQT